MDTIQVTCDGCGATYIAHGHRCPLCGTDDRHAVILTALREANREWDTVEEAADRILTALYAMGADDA